jgi:glutathione peroxidase-family protein
LNGVYCWFQFLKREIPCAEDEPFHIVRNEAMLMWDPLYRFDVASNFEKFVIDTCGNVVHR